MKGKGSSGCRADEFHYIPQDNAYVSVPLYNFAIAILTPASGALIKRPKERKNYYTMYALSQINTSDDIAPFSLEKEKMGKSRRWALKQKLPWNLPEFFAPQQKCYDVHTEYKLLSHFYNQLNDDFSEKKYNLYMYSDRDACTDCFQIINSFFNCMTEKIQNIYFYYGYGKKIDISRNFGWKEYSQENQLSTQSLMKQFVPSPIGPPSPYRTITISLNSQGSSTQVESKTRSDSETKKIQQAKNEVAKKRPFSHVTLYSVKRFVEVLGPHK